MITIDYITFIISVPKADTVLVQVGPPEIRELDLNTFRLALNDIMDDAEGIPFPTNHLHNPPLTSGGVTLARSVTILAPYTVTFEDGSYNVNIIGGNSNFAEVQNKNSVGINTANSAGLIDLAILIGGLR